MKSSIIALLALFMTATLTLSASSFQITTDDPPVMDCWTNEGDVHNPEIPPNASKLECDGVLIECCYDESGPHFKA